MGLIKIYFRMSYGKSTKPGRAYEPLFKKRFPTRPTRKVEAALDWYKMIAFPRLADAPFPAHYYEKTMKELKETDFIKLDPEKLNVFTLDTEGQVVKDKDSFMPYIIIGSLSMNVLIIDNREMKVFNSVLVSQALKDFLARANITWIGSQIMGDFEALNVTPRGPVLESSCKTNALRKYGLSFPLVNSGIGYLSSLIYEHLDYKPKSDKEFEEEYGCVKPENFKEIKAEDGTLVQAKYYTSKKALYIWREFGTKTPDGQRNYMMLDGRIPQLFAACAGNWLHGNHKKLSEIQVKSVSDLVAITRKVMEESGYKIFIKETWERTMDSYKIMLAEKQRDDQRYINKLATQPSKIEKDISRALEQHEPDNIQPEERIEIPPDVLDDEVLRNDLLKKKLKRKQDPFITTTDSEEEKLIKSLQSISEYSAKVRKERARKLQKERIKPSSTITSGEYDTTQIKENAKERKGADLSIRRPPLEPPVRSQPMEPMQEGASVYMNPAFQKRVSAKSRLGPPRSPSPTRSPKRPRTDLKEFGAEPVKKREQIDNLYSPAAKREFPRFTEGKRSWYCSFPDAGSGCSFCDGLHDRKNCPDRNYNVERKHGGRNQVEFCEYPICRNPFSHKTIRCETLMRVCRRCRRRGHTEKINCREDEEDLRELFENYRHFHKVTSNDLFKFRFPSKQAIYKTSGPRMDEEVSCSRPELLDRPEEKRRFRIRLEQIQHYQPEMIKKAAAYFALRYETKIRIAREFGLQGAIRRPSK